MKPLAAAVGLALAILVVNPGGGRVAAAEDGLKLTSSATYVLEPDEHRIRVTVDLDAENVSPDASTGGFTTRYYFEALRLALQPESTRVAATSGGKRLTVTSSPQDRFDRVDIRLPKALFYGDRAKVRLTYELPGAKPRSSSAVRVGAAFSTFVAWAFGDSGRVRIEVPAAYTVDSQGADLEAASRDSRKILTSGPIATASGWYAVVDARRDEALTSSRLEIATDEAVVVRGWPEDKEWVRRVGNVLSKGLPVLDEMIGLPWPVPDDLEVVEIHTPLLEGYAGIYDVSTDTITVSEDLDYHTILHEASHAWFNDKLFRGRWIGEGLADEYAAIALKRVEGATAKPEAVDRGARAAFALEDWLEPRPINDAATAAYEDYGYTASWAIVRQIVERVGIDRMREVLAAADRQEVAYLGEGPAETETAIPDWTRFLDLIEERTGTDVDDLFRTWVANERQRPLLDARASARDQYAALQSDGDDWAVPYAVRAPMTSWQFPSATQQMAIAREVLALRDQIDNRAAAIDVEVPPGLEAAYETAATDVADALEPAQDRLDGLADLEAATAAASATRDPFAELGLIGEPDPDQRLTAARTAFEAGDFEATDRDATAVVDSLAAAPEAGRTRAGLAGGVAFVTILVVAGVLVVRQRRGGRAVQPPGGTVTLATLPPTSPGDSVGPDRADTANQGGTRSAD